MFFESSLKTTPISSLRSATTQIIPNLGLSYYRVLIENTLRTPLSDSASTYINLYTCPTFFRDMENMQDLAILTNEVKYKGSYTN